ncbi:MAG: TldD/PmbA family protein [Asgard group archaeon]|nr:TldD/PmbA family protein [Asgard group archaeon]
MSEKLLKKTIDIAQKNGATETIARYTINPSYQIRFSNSNIDIYKHWESSLLEVFFAFKQKTTQVDILNPTEETVKKNIIEAAKFAKNLPDSQMYTGIYTEKSTYEQISGLYDKAITDFPQNAANYVNNAIQAAEEAGAKRAAGVLYFGEKTQSILTSNGLNGNYNSSYYRLTIRAFVDNESSGQDIVVGRKLQGVKNKFIEAGKHAGKIATMAEGGKQGKAGKYDVILSPTVAANIFGNITDGANPLMIFMNMSPIKDHMGEQIAPKNFTAIEDPHIPEGLESKPFDIEGTPTKKTPLIKNGAVIGLIHNTTSAQLMQGETTGNSELISFGLGTKILAPAPTNIVYQPGKKSLEKIIEESNKPTIYITSNWYTRFTNMLEGEFSTIPRDGMFLIEKGEIKKPLRKLRLKGKLLDMTKRIDAIGSDQKQIYWWEVNTPTFISSIKIKDCNITAATQ